MSTARTGRAQHRRLLDLGLTVATLPGLRDIDTAGDLAAVATAFPSLRTSAAAMRYLIGLRR